MPTRFPTLHFLTPDAPAVAPDGFARLRHVITGSLPLTLQLDATVRLILALPTGRARFWATLDPLTSLSRSADERAPRPDTQPAPPGAVAGDPPLRLIAVRGTVPIGVVPLTLGPPLTLPSSPGPGVGATLELVLLAWDIRAGNARGPGDYGAFIELAWRRADVAADVFGPPPVPDGVKLRLEVADRLESDVGLAMSSTPAKY